MVTIKDIANMANVSRGTVDRVLNNRGGVNPQTAERVRLIAERLHYSPCATGRGLAMMKKGMKLGFVRTSPPGSDSVPDRILDRKIQELSEYGIAVLSRSYPEGDIPSLLRVLDELAAQSVLGIAVSPVPCREAEEKINDLAGRGIAVVTYNHDLPDTRRLAFVGCDYYRNGRILAGLIRLIVDGRGKIGIVSGTLSAAAHAQRIYGLENRLAEDCPNVRVVSHAVCALDDVSTYAAVKKLLAENPGLDLLVLNTVSACGAIRAIREWPERVRVICVSCAPEMEPYLEDHTVDAMIMHQPWVQTDMSIDILFQYLVWGKKPASPAFFIDDEIILAENMRSQRMVP